MIYFNIYYGYLVVTVKCDSNSGFKRYEEVS